MTNQTETKTLSLRERWNSDTTETPNREKNSLRWELEDLLNKEIETGTNCRLFRSDISPKEQKLLEEFRSTFTWKQNFRVQNRYEVFATYDYLEDCDDAEELKSYLKGEKELPDSEQLREKGISYYDFDIDMDYVDHCSHRPSADIKISDLKLKPETEQKKTFIFNIDEIFNKDVQIEGVSKEEAEQILRKNYECSIGQIKVYSVEEVEVS